MKKLQQKTPRHINALIEQVCATPDDTTLRLVLADAFEEVGDDSAAECLRWMARNAIGPAHSTDGSCTWFLREIGPELYSELSGYADREYAVCMGWAWCPGCWRDYLTPRAGEYAIRVAWRKARRKGWRPR